MLASPLMASYPITAYSACNALGEGKKAMVEALRSGRTGLASVQFPTPYAVTCGLAKAELAPLPEEHAVFDTRQARLTWRTLEALTEAVEQAVERWGADRIGVIVGSSTGGIASTEAAYAEYVRARAVPHGFNLDRQHGMHATTDLIRRRFGLDGPAYVVSTACSSSGKVFGSAQRLLDAGIVDAVLVGGVDTLCQMTVRGFHSLEVLAPTPCRPFSSERAGINLGEAGALLLVERSGVANVELLGVGETNDAHHMSSPRPDGAGARAAMVEALDRAGLSSSDVGHVNAHATGTRQNDRAEALAIGDVFGNRTPVVGTKGYTGHTLGAAGATEAVLSIVAIEQGFVPPSIGATPVDPEVAVDVVTELRPMRSAVVVSNSFAFGGSNVSVVLGATR